MSGDDEGVVVRLDAYEVAAIRKALLLGLTCLAKIEDARDSAELVEACGGELPPGVKPIRPNYGTSLAGMFAEALSFV